ncbi:MAG: 4-alpha-glucanotransferase [Bacteriovoracaceae bacterium]|nr:4-alpha-glucanotransferase [Bacteriovoracaceae bacterium]
MTNRSSGVLLHVTSLPSLYGVGDLGPASYRFIDWLKKAGQSIWQVLPLGVSDRYGCPYASYSAFGGDPLLISPEILVDHGLVDKRVLELYTISSDTSADVDYSTVRFVKHGLFRQAFLVFKKTNILREEFDLFCSKHSSWAQDTALFLTLTNHYGEKWWLWPSEYKDYNSSGVEDFRQGYAEEIEFHLFLQFLFDFQWKNLKSYANEHGVDVVGDIPIFVAHHSMDVWRRPEHFKLEDNGELGYEAGAAPDAFSDTGQKWGTPLYQWELMEKENFSWWCDRMKYMHETFDLIRLDHFRGFCAVWQVPHRDKNAINGSWYKGPGAPLFEALEKTLGCLPIIVEDLGEITPDVIELRDKFNFPGMKILQFGFVSDHKNEHLPRNTSENFVVYTGTHDMETINGHFWGVPKGSPEKSFVLKELGMDNSFSEIDYSWPMIELAMESKASISIIPMQDILGLGNEGRMNCPGVLLGNWKWRFSYSQLDPYAEIKLSMLSKSSNRNN